MAIARPLINGKRFQHSDAEITIGTRKFYDFKSLNWNEGLQPGKVRGTNVRIQGRTKGIYDADGSFEMYMGEAEELLAELSKNGQGFMEQEFNVVINYQARGMEMVTVELIGCRIIKKDMSASEDENGLAYSFDLDIMEIRTNGLSAVGQR